MTAAKTKPDSKSKPKTRVRPLGPKSLRGSFEAKRHATVILEVLAGTRKPVEVCESLGISLMRYYLLETRALQGMLSALEPLPKGRATNPAKEIETLRQDRQRLERDLTRMQTLLRTTQRAAGLLTAPVAAKASKLSGKHGGKARRPRAVKSRATRAIEALWNDTQAQAGEAAEPVGEAVTS